jgi:hypothetical protein
MRLHIEPVLASQVLTLACGSGLLLLTVWLASRLMPPLWAWSAAGLLALNTPFLLYTSRGSGMETALFSLLTLATLAALVGRRWWLAGTLAALTMLTRPDGLIVAAVGGLYALLRSRAGQRASSTLHEPGTRNIPAALLAYTAPLLLIYLPYFLWRWSYYGYLLPNTFYAKVGGTTAQVLRGLGYLWDVGRGDALFLAAGVGFALGLWGWRRAADQGARWPEIGLLSGFTVLFSLYVVAVGGDWMPGARFFVPLIPVLAILTAWGLAGIAQGAPSLAAPALVVWVALAAALTLRLPLDSSYHPGSLVRREVGVVRHYRDVGHWIEQHTPPDTLIVAGPAGALPYYARRPTIDALGLNDEHIAHSSPAALGTGKAGHEKTDPDYVLARQPQVIPWSAAAYLRGHPALEQGYRLEQVIGPEGAEVRLFVRRDLPLLSGARRLNNAALLMMAADDAVKVPEQQRR